MLKEAAENIMELILNAGNHKSSYGWEDRVGIRNFKFCE